ncbi:hypothetical protein JHK84_043602 [Glycine max]|uniref:Putative disease resistance RPP13-like protein 1 n=1 Tax=Glycine soja TaxID=3848 RepID=A0A0B2RJJ0_GLYSO|nr:hypothetical protein JHK87_043309 [Glycine soja]KAG4950181.1 hypothetical protein JHK86_043420 [Glycine max]KAG5117489.1 hypothetical protein JHK84_043602 [Glycine max]KHN32002.1 Putative disease resistance RPP13-like protein 1 [Glycine soja]
MKKKQFRDARVRDWLLKAKDVVFEAEDLWEDMDNELQSDHLGLKKASGVVVGSGSGSKVSEKLSSTSLLSESIIYGRDDDKEIIFNWLISDIDNKLSILSIVGMGRLGMTMVAQHVYNDPRMDDKFDIKAWVCVSEDFDVFNVSRAILDTISGSTDRSRELEMVQTRLKEKLTIIRLLYHAVRRAPPGGITRRLLLALFAKHAFQSSNPQANIDFKEIDMKIVEKCKGLPLALKTMGSLLHNKSSVREWENIFKSEIWEFSEMIAIFSLL